MKRIAMAVGMALFAVGVNAENLATAAGTARTISLRTGQCTGGSLENAFNGADGWAAASGQFSAADEGFVPPSEEQPVTIDFAFDDSFRSGQDLGVTRFVISAPNNYWGGSYGPDYRPSAPSYYKIYGSTDGSAWTLLNDVDGITLTAHIIIPVAKRGNYRHFRFVFTKNAGYTGTDHATLFIQNIGIYSDTAYYATVDGSDANDGLTWATATSLTNAFAKATAEHFNELHVQAGTYRPPASLVATKMMTFIGGYAGTGDDPDAITGRSVIDAQGAYDKVFSCDTSPGNYLYGYFTHLENLELRGGTEAGVYWGTGNASMEAFNCRFVGNRGNRASTYNQVYGGRGLFFNGNFNVGANSRCNLYDCEFIDNGLAAGVGKGGKWDGCGAFFQNYGTVTLENCLFASNGVAQTALPYTDGLFGMKGHALCAAGMFVKAKNCRFLRNRGTSGWNGNWPGALGGATVYAGASGNVFERCLFLANEGISAATDASSSHRGAMGTLTVGGNTRIEGCTFAYNLVDGLTASAGLNVSGGLAAITNSLFYGNVVGSKATVGADIHVASAAYLNMAHAMLSAASALTVEDATHVTNDTDSVLYDNPRFVTTSDAMAACRTADANALIYYDPAEEATVAAADVHLTTPAGYRKNGDATWYTESSFTSAAIDAGTGDYANEPTPNGGVRNLGFYGNSSEASKSAEKPHFAIGAIPVQFYDGVNPCRPVPPVTDLDSGAALTPAQVTASFDAVYADNETYGTAMVTLTGKTGTSYAGQSVSAEFTISARFHVTNDVAAEGDGLSWASPMTLTNAIAHATRTTDEILMKAGTYAVDATIAVPRAMAIRGGYAGTDDETLAADPISSLDGQGTLLTAIMSVAVDTSAAERNVFERLAWTRGGNRGLVKSGAASIELLSCRITHNTDGVAEDNYYGIGARLSGAAGATEAVLSNCLVAANVESKDNWFSLYGRGLSATSLKRLVLVGCTFVSNGIPHSADRTKWYAFARQQRGAALYAEAAPVLASNCVFRANRGCGLGGNNAWGGIVWLEGACGGSSFDHCLFAGNQQLATASDDGRGDLDGTVTARLSSGADACDFGFCTFLGNLADTRGGSAALNLRQGAFTLHDSVFAHNVVGSYALGGADVCLAAGTLTASHTLFGGSGEEWIRAESGATLLTADRGNLYGDAKTVTAGTNVLACVDSTDKAFPACVSPVWYGNAATNLAAVLAFDAHLLSPEGYRRNGSAAWFTDTSVLSPAIDKADPDAPWANEPQPNGSRANLGCYANTAEASKTASGEPAAPADVTVTYPDGYSQPQVAFAVGGTGYFSADVTVRVGTNGTDWVYVESILGQSRGDTVTVLVPHYFAANAKLYVRVELTTESSAAANTVEKTVTAPEPPWFGRKGPAGVIHVRAGATGRQDGTSWTDAYDDVLTALRAATAGTNELWLSGTFVHLAAYEAIPLSVPVRVRGGFAGSETNAADRAAGCLATIDGNHRASPLAFANAASVAIERVAFRDGSGAGLVKSGAGDLALNDCRVEGNGWLLQSAAGYGAALSGDGSTTEVTLSNCTFGANGIAPSESKWHFSFNNSGTGHGCHFSDLRRARLYDCSFMTNGVPFTQTTSSLDGYRSMSGSAIYATDAPVTAVGCRFVANRCYATGGTVVLAAGTDGSAFTNCLFLGNQDNAFADAASSNGGALRIAGASADERCDIVHCTFYANLADSATVGGAVSVHGGTARVRNCLFDGNLNGVQRVADGGATDVSVASGAAADVAYTLFSTTNGLWAADGATLARGAGLMFGEPNLVTPGSSFKYLRSYLSVWVGGDVGNVSAAYYRTDSLSLFLSADAHPRGAGYADAATGGWTKRYPRRGWSAAVDAADPAAPFAREPKPHGHRANLGCYGNTPQATLSESPGFYVLVGSDTAAPAGRAPGPWVTPQPEPGPLTVDADILVCDQADQAIKVYDGVTSALKWCWKGSEDTSIASSYRSGFSGNVAECKPLENGAKVAMVSNGERWAIVDRATTNAVAYGVCPGSPHSIEVLPDDVVAVASTHTWGAEDLKGVYFFDIAGTKATDPTAQDRTFFLMDNPHGLYWDATTNRLWVCDTTGLHLGRVGRTDGGFTFAIERVWNIADLGLTYAHDMRPVPGTTLLVVTTYEKVMFFDLSRHEWAEEKAIFRMDAKGFDPFFAAGGEPFLATVPRESWWTDTLETYADGTFRDFRTFTGAKIYKARWIPR